ncbi:MAG: DUF2934 domain-containing protein [Terriglobales bacterium]
MARKTSGSASPRSRKTDLSTAPAVASPTTIEKAPEVVKNLQATAVAATKTAVHTPNANLDEEIRRRAYELYLQRNGTAGDPNRDWIVAEHEVRARHATAGR